MSAEEAETALAAIPAEQQVQAEQVSEERANRVLQRIDLLNKVRGETLLKHPKFDEWLNDDLSIPGAADLPDWYVPGRHDRDLVRAVARYGLTRPEFYYMNDADFSFRLYLDKYMRHIERMMDAENAAAETVRSESPAPPRLTDPIQFYFQNQVRIQITFKELVLDREGAARKRVKQHEMRRNEREARIKRRQEKKELKEKLAETTKCQQQSAAAEQREEHEGEENLESIVAQVIEALVAQTAGEEYKVKKKKFLFLILCPALNLVSAYLKMIAQ